MSHYPSHDPDAPSIHRVTEKPQIEELKRELDSAINSASEFYDRNEHALNTTYCWWENQTRDGRKHGSLAAPPFPWELASDVRIRTLDMIIQEKIDLIQLTLARMNVQVIPTQAKDADFAGRMTALLRWYVANEMADEADSEIEPLCAFYFTYGSAVLHVGWLQQLAYELKTVRLEELLEAAKQAGGQQAVAQTLQTLFDPAQIEVVRGLVQKFSSFLTRGEAERVVRDLQTQGQATFPKPYVHTSRPSLTALQTFQEVYFPVNTHRLQKARFIAQPELLTETELREKVEGRERWDADFVKDVLEHKGRTFNRGLTAQNIVDRQREVGGIWGEWTGESDDMYEVWHFHYRASFRGIPAIFRTILHPECVDYHGLHEMQEHANGLYPHVEFVREKRCKSILASRGLPELLDTQQSEIKTQRDSRTDRASITTMPPVKVRAKTGHKKNTYGPGVEIPVIKMEDVEVMSFGQPDMTSIEVERSTKHDVNEFSGRAGDGVDPQLVINSSQATVNRFLRRFQVASKMVLQLAQQYTEPMTIGRVIGMIPKPYEITREAIAGQFNLMLSFDPRVASPEYLMKLMEQMQKYVISIDSNAIVQRDELIRYIMHSIDPTLADLCVRDKETAEQSEVEDEMMNFALMFSGQEPPMKLQGQDFGARLRVLQATLKRNPVLQQMLTQRPDLQGALERRADFLQQQVAQEKNKVIGRYGTTPSPGSAGVPQLGALAGMEGGEG